MPATLTRSGPTLALLLTACAAATAADDGTAPAGLPALGSPQLTLILDGVAYADSIQGAGAALAGEAAGISHAHADDHATHGDGGLEQGFNLREAEVVMSATVDTLFDAYANLAFGSEGVELEEAYFTTRALPAGWQLKGGKFLSGFGYANGKHPHSRDFVDQNLAYLSLVGDHGINDTGLQVTWSPATTLYVQLGAEALQGHDQEKFGGEGIDLADVARAIADADAAGTLAPAVTPPLPTADTLPAVDRRGPQLFTAFVKMAPDLGTDHALQLGASYARHLAQQEMHEEPDPAGAVEAVLYADGSASLLGLEAVYKRAATGRYGVGALRVQAEYLRLEKDMHVIHHTDPAAIGMALAGTQDAFYIEGVYGFAPRWQAGLRYDITGMASETAEGGVTTSLADSSRVAAVATFRPSEFSYWRLQLADADITDDTGAGNHYTQVMLQYNLSLGAHGAHSF